MKKILFVLLFCFVSGPSFASERFLKEGWAVQSSAQVRGDGSLLSTVGVDTRTWMQTEVPSTVVGAMWENQLIDDPYYGMNLRTVPGTNYPINEIFSDKPMPTDSPFLQSWWYRTEFPTPAMRFGRRVFLHFDGISFSANIWLNGKKIADAADIAGTYRTYDLDVTDALQSDGRDRVNALAVEVFAPAPESLASTWVDWNPVPGDKNMGIWRDVYLRTTGPVTVADPGVATLLDSTELAHLTVSAEVSNTTSSPITGVLHGKIGDVAFKQSVQLKAHETRQVVFDPALFPQLNIAQPRLWWPTGMGEQELYPLRIHFDLNRTVSDELSVQFGIREVTSELGPGDVRLFRINGRKLFVRGGGWAPDMLLRSSPEREEQELKYVRDLGLNTIRIEGKFETDHFLELADRYGILVMPGWACCSQWQEGAHWAPADYPVARESLRSQLRRHKIHPSVFVFLYGSDEAPPKKVEKMYLQVLESERWPNPTLAAASDQDTLVGKTGVKMTGPYDYVPPSYWYVDTQNGGNFGFNTETSMGPAVPPIESIKKMLPEAHWWPVDLFWDYHCGVSRFQQIEFFTRGLNARYGEARSLEEFAMKSQVLAYDGHRAMFEAYAKGKFEKTTGIIQWMLNNAWPGMIWHLYDYYLRPGGSYFGAKKANEPVHVQYSYDDQSVVVVNNLGEPLSGLEVDAQILDFNLQPRFREAVQVTVPADSSTVALSLPNVENLTRTYFIRLELKDARFKVLSRNFYWLSTQKEIMDWANTDFTRTPTLQDGDMTLLNSLSRVKLDVVTSSESGSETGQTHVTLRNPSSSLAFFVRLKVIRDTDGEEVLPVLWEDNYISLLPGESREITARYTLADLGNAKAAVEVSGWNVESVRRP